METREKSTILLVDDEPDFLDAARRILESAGYQVLAASGAQEALEAVRGRDISLAVLDVNLPGTDGYELCRELREGHAGLDLPVLFLSVRGGLRDILYGVTLGARDYLAKPIGSSELLRAVARNLAA